MTKQITPEQRDWLIEQFNTVHSKLMAKPSDGMFHIMDCRLIIEECTDVPFPRFEINDEINTHRYSVNLNSDGFLKLTNGHGHVSTLSPAEFQEFTDGCNKIADWLHEKHM